MLPYSLQSCKISIKKFNDKKKKFNDRLIGIFWYVESTFREAFMLSQS